MLKLRVGDHEIEITDTVLEHPRLMGCFVTAYGEEDENIQYHITDGSWGVMNIMNHSYNYAEVTRQILVNIAKYHRDYNRF